MTWEVEMDVRHGHGDDHESWRPVGGSRAGEASLRVIVLISHEDTATDVEPDVLDDWRGLSPLGHRRAGHLVEQLDGVAIHRVLSGPALRCRQTVIPLAQDRGLDIEPLAALAAGADVAALAALLDDPAHSHVAICTDPLTMELLLEHLATRTSTLTEVTVTQAGPAVVLTARLATGSPDTGSLAQL